MADLLLSGFLSSAARFPDRPALDLGGRELSYSELLARAAASAAFLGLSQSQTPTITGVFAARSEAAYVGILAALYRGETYLPLNPGLPTARLAYMLEHSGCTQLIADSAEADALDALLDSAKNPVTVTMADCSDAPDLAERHPRHRILGGTGAMRAQSDPRQPDPGDPAYLLYTSGSTGRPKGVAVSHKNVAHFLAVCADRYEFDETDRFSQMFDLGFDLSVFDLFMAWSVGACVCVPGPGEQMLPAAYISRSNISVWFSVPSVAVLLNRLRQLEPGAFPDLRLSLFCGEALQSDAARAWTRAAPNGMLENLYGPTEATIACTGFRWTGEMTDEPTVPIGYPFAGLTAKVVDDDLNEVAAGTPGELLIAGPQVALGYWKDRDKTKAAFVNDPASGARAYRTGDLVRRPASDAEP